MTQEVGKCGELIVSKQTFEDIHRFNDNENRKS